MNKRLKIIMQTTYPWLMALVMLLPGISAAETVFISANENGFDSVSWDNTGLFFATGSSDKTIKIWGMSKAGKTTLRATIDEENHGHLSFVNSVDWHPSGKLLASGSLDSTLIISLMINK